MGITSPKPLVLLALLLCFVVAVSSQGGCPRGKGVCVKDQYCRSGKRGTEKKHKCKTENGRRGICCNYREITLDKACRTSKGEWGRCIAEDQCGGYTRDFLLGIKTDDSWKTTSNVCYEENETKYYCCPKSQQKPTPKPHVSKGIHNTWENEFPSCKRPDNVTGRCVPMYLCNRFGELVLDKQPGLKYETIKATYKCPSDASDSTSICCRDPDAPQDLIRYAKARRLHPNNCGRIGTPNRVLGGDEAGRGEFPWMANLMSYQKNIKTTVCSGSLIHAQYVLTAAHCFKNGNPISVRLGEHDLSKEEDCVEKLCTKYMEYGIAKLIPHERYKQRAGQYDIALVKLNKPAEINVNRIYPICLPVTNEWLMTKPSQLIASGWGRTEHGRYPDILRHATLQGLNYRPYYCAKEQMICARGANGEGHCRCDSGGPLQQTVGYGNRYRTVLFGVISGGDPNCTVDSKQAGVSVLVGYHIKWILDNMEI